MQCITSKAGDWVGLKGTGVEASRQRVSMAMEWVESQEMMVLEDCDFVTTGLQAAAPLPRYSRWSTGRQFSASRGLTGFGDWCGF